MTSKFVLFLNKETSFLKQRYNVYIYRSTIIIPT